MYLGVDTRVVPFSTAEAPGDNPLQLPATHHRAARVSLRRAGRAQLGMTTTRVALEKPSNPTNEGTRRKAVQCRMRGYL